MTLLAEYAITPDVFDVASYAHPDACDAELRNLKDVLLTEGLVRDLRVGEWRRLLMNDERPWHRRGRELLKHLARQNRLVPYEPTLEGVPADDSEWCEEALGTHRIVPFTGGIVATAPVKAAFPAEEIVARIDRLTNAPWWAVRSPSVTLHRGMEDYKAQLAPVLRRANSLMFIDPHLDPARLGYRDFPQLLEAAGKRIPAPAIEIHRVCYEGSRQDRSTPSNNQSDHFERRFRDALEVPVRGAGLRVKVFIWDDFHDRYLISDLIGILLSNGFDTTANPTSVTCWSRLGRQDWEDKQREFDQASGRHKLWQQFVIE